MRRNTVLPLLAVVAVTVLVIGCASVGSEFQSNRVNDIKIGQSTKSDVFNMFGRPYSKGVENGDQTWTYVDYRYTMGKATKSRDLKVIFDKNDRVKSYTYNTNFPNEFIE